MEDRREDVLLLARACEMANLLVNIFEVRNGAEAMAYLKGEADFNDRRKFPIPDLIVLDLRLPDMDGFAFLRWVKGDVAFNRIPVVVFTEAISTVDKACALAEGAAGYFIKPLDFGALAGLVEACRPM